ncbi:MAG TPA: hypothetical protein VNZ64_13425 [Candidatus Acidoferrum sp.]|nr:hypothetical protein [Candidatus Acidoferrum sp.]
MKRIVGYALVAVGLGGLCWGQPMPFYVNDGVVNSPPDPAPQIDALNFINNNTFTIIITNFAINSQLWDSSDTVNFTNNGVMTGAPGFQLDTAPSYNGFRVRAGSIVNNGTINVGGATNLIAGFNAATGVTIFTGLPKLIGNATNIVNSGALNLGFESLCTLSGENVDMTRGTLAMQQTGVDVYNGSFFFNGGMFSGYWGLGFNTNINPARYNFQGATTPVHTVTNRYYTVFGQILGGSANQLSYVDDVFTTPNNREVRAVFLANTNLTLQPKVYFPEPPTALSPFGDIVVEWSSAFTDAAGNVTTNYLYLFDAFGFNFGDNFPANEFGLVIHDFAGPNPAFIPYNYLGPFFFTFGGGFLNFNGGFFPSPTPLFQPGSDTPASIIPGGTFPNINVTNQFAAYEGLFLPSSAVPADIAGGNVTNLPGRIMLTADKFMDLSHAHISSLNYLSLTSTNHFAGSEQAQISSPFCDINLRSTNGLLTITNLLSPTLAHPEGTIECYSARFTNVVGTITNSFHVLFVNSVLSPQAPSRVQSLTLRSTNFTGLPDSIVISDVLNILSNSFTIDTTSLTIATNAPGSPTPTGAINLLSSAIVFSTATPRLQYLTNYGFIQTLNAVFFGGSRSAPYYSSTFNEPYRVFVNRGGVTNFGSLIWATNFQNSGTFWSQNGNISLQLCLSALMTNGTFLAPGNSGTIDLEAANLFISNHVLLSSGSLTLAITNSLDDGSLAGNSADAITNKNFWSVRGLNLLAAPAAGSLLGTTVTNTDPSYSDIPNVWAAADLGTTPAGFAGNSALGHLILDGLDPDSHFTFSGVGVSNALYVDLLDLRGSTATNIDAFKSYIGVTINPGMKIYYGQALANGVSIAERLNGKNGGGFLWVSNYNTGFFSSINVVYPDGSTNRLNAALVNSCDIDSNNNGIPNCIDPAPISILSPAGLALAVAVTYQPAAAAVVSWTAFPSTTNFLYAAPLSGAANWQLVTNFVYSGRFPSRVAVTDLIKTNAPRFYRVRVSSP